MSTFTKISTITVGSGGAASIDFTSIPATYTDLKLVVSGRTNRALYTWDTLNFTLNGSGTGFTAKYLQGEGSTAISGSGNNMLVNGASATTSTFSSIEMYLPNYSSANYKSISIDNVTETNATTNAFTVLQASLWSNSAAINQITLTPAFGSFNQYSSATLYGIKSS